MPKYDDTRIHSLAALLEDRARNSPDVLYGIFPDATITYRQLFARARAVAKGLLADGLAPGEHVAVLMPNCLEYLVAHYAIQLAGGVSVLVNSRFKQHELAHAIADSDSCMVITTDAVDEHVDFADLLDRTFQELASARTPEFSPVAKAPKPRRLVLFGTNNWDAAVSEAALVQARQAISDTDLAAC